MNRTKETASVLRHYLGEARKFPPLVAADELALVRRAKGGDQAARDRLVKSNLRFVIKLAREYESRGIPLDVLINEGVLGLFAAIDHYDETKGTRFTQYAAWWVRNHIRESIAAQVTAFTIPVKKIDLEHKVRETWGRFEQQHGRKPSIFEIADELSLTEGELVDVIRVYSTVSLSLTDKESLAGRFQIPVEECVDIKAGDLAIKRLVKFEINDMIKSLDKKDAQVLALFFGINADRRYTLEEIGDQLSVSRERVRQIKEEALEKLRHSPQFKKLEIFMSVMLESHTLE
jgi:RNA polymerase primary sigma factor